MEPGWVVGLGEILWDVFPDGARFGGAPANFACHARALGAKVAMVSAVGPDSDRLSLEALKTLEAHGVDTRGVSRNHHETGRVLVELDPLGHPSYRFSEISAWDCIVWNSELESIAHQCGAVCFGTLAQRAEPSASTIQRFVAALPDTAWKIFDVNLRCDFWTPECIVASLSRANVLKLNSDELPVVAQACGITNGLRVSEVATLQALRRLYNLRLVALTRGSAGATLVTLTEVNECPAPDIRVADTVGAGDAYTAAMSLGVIKGWPLCLINQRAVAISAHVCSQPGATPALPSEFRQWYVQP